MSDSLQDRREALKPCPFCGDSAEIERRDNGLFYVCCEGCLSQTYSRLEDDAIAAWNRRVDSQVQESGWQPIETAPKDGTAVFAYWSPEGASAAGPKNYGVTLYRNGEWRCVDDEDDLYGRPTHWTPLPAAPKEPK